METHQPHLSIEALKTWYRKNQDQVRQDFFTFLRFPSISTDPHYAQDVRKAAEWAADFLKKSGMDVEVWETAGHPVVFGSHLHAGPDRPTLLLYAHYDVQPVDPLELWDSSPFEPRVKDGEVYARGACDDKGQCYYTMVAIKAFLELCNKSGVNIKFLIEGEEECGGLGTKGVLAHKKGALKADYLMVVDMDIPDPTTPALTMGCRGLVTLEVICANALTDLHSGTHGGIALNPNRILATLLSKLWDEKGCVVIPHFYDAVKTLSPEEKKAFFLEFHADVYQRAFGVHALCTEPGFSPIESNVLRPTLEINGMWGGYTGVGFKTVIPEKAHAKISVRLVPDQDPQVIGGLVAAFLESHCPKGVRLNVSITAGEKAFRGSPDTDIAHIAEKSYEEVFQKRCVLRLSGGSIPIVPHLVSASGAECAMMGLGLDSDHFHAPNEHFGLDRLEKGFLVMSRILVGLSSS